MKEKLIKVLNKKSLILVVAIAITAFATFELFTNYTEDQIRALGFDKNETIDIVEEHGPFNAYDVVKSELEKEVEEKEFIFTNEIGESLDVVGNKDKLTLVEYSELLDVKTEELRVFYETEIELVTSSLVVYPLVDEDIIDYAEFTLADEFTSKMELLTKYESTYNDKLESLKASLRDYGVRQAEIDSLITDDIFSSIDALEEKESYMKEYNALVSTSGNTYAAGAMDLFNRLNDHRVSKGLPAFRYNAEGQSCVDVEANSYANNKNPHNWLCKSLTSEGASLASVNSDYIKIAGDFLTTHGSHERDVVMPEYVSAACSAVERDGMVYMICGYFTY